MPEDGWFADQDQDKTASNWVAVLQTAGGCFPLDGIWFYSKEDADSFIRDCVLGMPQHL